MIAVFPKSETVRYGLVLLTCTIISVAWIPAAAFWLKAPSHGGQGGALGVAISFVALFSSREHGARFHKAIKDYQEVRKIFSKFEGAEFDVSQATAEVDNLRTAFNVFERELVHNARSQRRQNVCLALSSGISTLAWGFGDVLAVLLYSPTN